MLVLVKKKFGPGTTSLISRYYQKNIVFAVIPSFSIKNTHYLVNLQKQLKETLLANVSEDKSEGIDESLIEIYNSI